MTDFAYLWITDSIRKPKWPKKGREDCISATFSTRDELTQLTTTWEISNISLAFLHIKISIEGNGLCTSVCLLLTFRFTYLLVVLIFASITSQVFYFFSQFLRLCRLFSDDSDFSLKSEATCHFFFICREVKEVSEISLNYFRDGWKELTVIENNWVPLRWKK